MPTVQTDASTTDLPVPGADAHWALFLDVDSTIAEFAPTPEAMRLSLDLRGVLLDCVGRFSGAVALLSARPLEDLDRLLDPVAFPAAGLNGGVRRTVRGAVKRTGGDRAQAIEAFMAERPFAGRRPVLVGDASTDENAFATIRALGGWGIRVGNAQGIADFRAPDTSTMFEWLTTISKLPPPTAPR